MKGKTPKQIRNLTLTITITAGLFALLGATLGSALIAVIGIVGMLTGVALHLIFYRCPHCGKFLDRSTGDFCPYCGEDVNEERN